jgi:hypothetical protein
LKSPVHTLSKVRDVNLFILLLLLLFYYLLTLAGGGKPRLRQDIQDNIQLQDRVKTIKTLEYTAFKKMTKIYFRFQLPVGRPPTYISGIG